MSSDTPRPAPLPRLDEAALALLREAGGDDDFIVELLGDFKVEGPRTIAGMRAALAAGDGKTLTRLAHSMKGTARSFGAGDLGDICEALEKEARQGETSGAAARIEGITEAFELAVRGLHELLAARRA